MDWQPIETAPRDGAAVLVYDENLTYEIAYRYRAEWRYGPKGYSCKPTHWMPLPAPPKDRPSEEIIRADRDAWEDRQP